MYHLKENLVTIHTCFNLLSFLDSEGYETMWIRLIWNTAGFNNVWCARRCVEVINRLGLTPPNDMEELYYIEERENYYDV